MLVFIIIVAYIIIIYFDGIPLIRRGKKKEMLLYSVMMTASLVLSILLSLGVEVPSPAVFIEKLVSTVIK
ncbi:hypothetical protein SH2C18_32530 [Clostridium sediminicola]|uniref:hypothetical protein n=1 Tax=Clostridium sediminicola TaxID=3114879 RepID=UPI0031F21DFB